MNRREELEEQLWEFVFDLLPSEQAKAIRQRITSEPEVARLYAETKLQAEIVSEAVKMRQARIPLTAPDPNIDTRDIDTRDIDTRDIDTRDIDTRDAPAATDLTPARDRRKQEGMGWRLGNWFATLAAAALLCYLGYAYYQPSSPIREVAVQSAESALVHRPARMTVLGVEQLQSSTNYYTVMARTATGEPRETDVNVSIYGPDDEVIAVNTFRTDSSGIGQVATRGFSKSRAVRLNFEPLSAVGTLPSASVQLDVQPDELSTHLASDRAVYRPGASVRYRSVTLSRYELQVPPPTTVEFAVLDSQGELVPGSQQTVQTDFGVGSGSLVLSAQQPSGKYELVARSPENRFPETRRAFRVRSYRTPKWRKELRFALDSYAPGEEVVADLTVRGPDSEIVRNVPLEIVAEVDNQVHFNLSTATDDEGAYQIRFDLPDQMSRGEGLVQVTVGDQTQEQIVAPIPINIELVSVEFFPESGDLVAGVKNRVYFFAHDPQGKPVHIQGGIVDREGNEVTSLQTIRDGRGVFALTPSADQSYRLELQTEATLATDPTLPATSQRQYLTLDAGPGVFAADASLDCELRTSGCDRLLAVTAACRGRQVGLAMIPAERFTAAAGADPSCRVTIDLDQDASGVIRLTVYDYSELPPQPLAERLVYRHPRNQLQFDVSGSTADLTPGSQVSLSLLAKDESRTRQSAALGVSVVDEAALSLVRDNSASLTTHFWLLSQIDDVRGLEDANFCMQEDEPSAQSLDLLLGTQGWRRFQSLPPAPFAQAGDRIGFGDADEVGPSPFAVVADEPMTPQLLVDNQRAAVGAVVRDLASLRRTFESDRRRIGRVLFFGGLVLVISLVMLAVMRRATAPVWIPALGAAALCLVLGGVWMAAQIEQSNPWRSVAAVQDESATQLTRGETTSVLESPVPATSEAFREQDVEQVLDGYAVQSDALRKQVPRPVESQLAEAEESSEVDSSNDLRVLGKEETAAAAMAATAAKPAAESARRRIAGKQQDTRPAERHDAATVPESGQRPVARSAIAARSARETVEHEAQDALGRLAGGRDEADVFLGKGQSAAGEAPQWGDESLTPESDVAKDEPALGFSTPSAPAALSDLETPLPEDKKRNSLKQREAVAARGLAESPSYEFRPLVRRYATWGRARSESDAIETVYWNPFLIADPDNPATVRFQLPEAETTYRLLINGHGGGRLGSYQDTIIAASRDDADLGTEAEDR